MPVKSLSIPRVVKVVGRFSGFRMLLEIVVAGLLVIGVFLLGFKINFDWERSDAHQCHDLNYQPACDRLARESHK